MPPATSPTFRPFNRLRTAVGLVAALAILASLILTAALPTPTSAFTTGQEATLALGQAALTTQPPVQRCGTDVSETAVCLPSGVAVDPVTGKVFVSDTTNHRILRYNSFASLATGQAAEIVLGQASFSGATQNRGGNAGANTLFAPSGLAFDSTGTLWVADKGNNRVLGFYSAGTSTSGTSADIVLGQADFTSAATNRGAASPAQNSLAGPLGLTVDSAGDLWVADSGNHRVLGFADAANLATDANATELLGQADFTGGQANRGGSGAANDGFNTPYAVIANSNGQIWVADELNHRVLRFDDADATADSVLGQTSFTGNTANAGGVSATSLQFPRGLAIDRGGRLYVADSLNHRILIFNNAGTKGNGGAADGLLGQAGFTVNGINRGVAVSAGGLNEPIGMTVDSASRLWVADSLNVRTLAFLQAEVAVAVAPTSVPEDGPDNLVFTFTRTGATTEALVVSFVVSGTAILDTNYVVTGADTFTATAGTITIPAGQTSAALTVNPTPDLLDQPDKTVILTIGGGSGFAAGVPNVATGTISNDDAPKITSPLPTNGTFGAAYNHTFVATGSPAPTFSVTAGTLPPGLTLNETTGVLSGTATAAGLFSAITVSATNGVNTDTQTFAIEIAKAPLTVTAIDKIRRVGQANPPLTLNYSGFVLNQDETVLDTLPTAQTAATQADPVGAYPITVSGGADNNYSFTYVNGTLTITDKEIPTITWATPAAITYGTALSATQLNATATSGGQAVAGSFVYDPPLGTILPAGTGQLLKVTFTPSDSVNLAVNTDQVQLTVNRASLTITADNKTMIVGQTVPPLTARFSGFVNNETPANLDVQPRLSTTATSNSPSGTYPITVDQAADANYTITFVPGTLTVQNRRVYIPIVLRNAGP